MVSEKFLQEFDALNAKRQRFLDSIQENNLEGLLTQLTEIYPDEAHFIFELLQNAEDAEATQVKFFLNKNMLAFRHNGTRPFSIQDIEAITNYGNSTKKVESNKIGKFGVGFKSVFAYTSKPIINSNGFTFSITQTTLPAREVVDPKLYSTFEDGWTTFLFYFDEPSKSPSRAYSEILTGLNDLDERALIFLAHINKIVIHYANDLEVPRTIEKFDLGSNKFGFLIKKGKEEQRNHFFVLRGKMPSVDLTQVDESVRSRIDSLNIGIAFALNSESEGSYSVVPIEGANVCVYFPAIKEDSGLKFHIHAPFASTPSRDVIRNSPENRLIITGISSFLVSKLDEIKSENLLTESFLSALPNGYDRLNPLYEVFRTDIVSAYKNGNEYLPLGSGKYIGFRNSLTATQQVQNALGPHLLRELYRYASNVPANGYAFLPVYKTTRSQQFVAALAPANLTITDVKNLLRNFMMGNRPNSLQTALTALTPEQLRNFFILFSSIAPESLRELRELPFIPINSNYPMFASPSEAFLPSKSFTDGHNMISAELIDPENIDANLFRSFENLGLRVLDDWTLLDINIEKLARAHTSGEQVSDIAKAKAIENLKDFAKSVGRDSERLKKLTSLNLFIGVAADGNLVWTSLDDVFVDLPFEATGLSSVRKYLPRKYKLWEGYADTPLIELFISNSKALTRLTPSKMILSNGSFDWRIPFFEEMLDTGDHLFSLSIWEMLSDSKNEQYRWEIKADKVYGSYDYSESSFIKALIYSAWLPCQDGKKRRPTVVNREILDSKFRYRDSKYMKSIKFDGSSEEAAQRQRLEARVREEKNTLAKELGFQDYSEVELIQKMKKTQPEIFKNLVASLENHFPEEVVDDLESSILEATKLAGSAEEVRIVENVIRERKNYASKHAELKEFLRSTYTRNGHLKCQICDIFMPFQLSSGEDYFEAVYFIRNLSKEIKHNGLALCPTCAARYKYTIKSSSSEIADSVRKADISGIGLTEIPIKMGKLNYVIKFTEDHIATLKGILKDV